MTYWQVDNLMYFEVLSDITIDYLQLKQKTNVGNTIMTPKKNWVKTKTKTKHIPSQPYTDIVCAAINVDAKKTAYWSWQTNKCIWNKIKKKNKTKHDNTVSKNNSFFVSR